MIPYIEKISKHVVLTLFTLIIGFLAVISLLNTCYLNENEHTYYSLESGTSFLILAGILLLLFLLYCKLKGRLLGKLKIQYIVIASILLGIFYVMISQVHPRADQRVCLSIAEQMHQGNYEAFGEGKYIQTYPQQVGIVLVYYVLGFLFGPHNIVALQMINVAAYVLFLIGIYKIANKLFRSETVASLSALLCLMFLPLLFYTSFIYGTMLGLCASTHAFYKAMEYMDGKKFSDAVLCTLLAGLAVLVKKNYLIVMVALLIMLMLHVIIKKHYRAILLVAALIASYVCFTAGPRRIAEQMTGTTIGDGLPSIAWVTMGLQEGSRANGWYNSYSIRIYQDNDFDSIKTSLAAKEDLSKRLQTFADDPMYTVGFFTMKTASQWAEPSFGSFFILRDPLMNMEESPLLTSLIHEPANSVLLGYLNLLQSVIYIGILLFAIYDRKRLAIWDLLPAIIFLGGFLFHLFWEAKGQYTFCYFILLFPYCIRGYAITFRKAAAFLQKERSAACIRRAACSPLFLLAIVCVLHMVVVLSVPDIQASVQALNTASAKNSSKPQYLSGLYRLSIPNGNEYLTFNLDNIEEFSLSACLSATKEASQLISIQEHGAGSTLIISQYCRDIANVSLKKIVNEQLEKRKSFYNDPNEHSLILIHNADGTYSVRDEDGYALTRSTDGEITLEAYNKSNKSQKWEFQKVSSNKEDSDKSQNDKKHHSS